MRGGGQATEEVEGVAPPSQAASSAATGRAKPGSGGQGRRRAEAACEWDPIAGRLPVGAAPVAQGALRATEGGQVATAGGFRVVLAAPGTEAPGAGLSRGGSLGRKWD